MSFVTDRYLDSRRFAYFANAAVLLLLTTVTLAGAEPAKVINHEKARDHVGQEVSVEITIIQTGNIGRICFLNVDKTRDFVVPVFSETFKDVPGGEKPEKYYLNKKVRVTGKVTLYKEKPQIEVHDLRQIEVLEDPDAKTAGQTTTPAKPVQPADFNLPHIKPEAAADHLGKNVVVEGMFEHLQKKAGNYVFDYGEYPAEDQLTLIMPEAVAKKFPSDPEALFLYQHSFVSGLIESVANKPVLRIHQPDQIRFDRLGEKLSKTEIVSVSTALERNGKYLGVKGDLKDVNETDLFYFVQLRDANGAELRIAVDKVCMNPNNALATLKKADNVFYGTLHADRKSAHLIIGDAREIIPESLKPKAEPQAAPMR